mmetsp:Transcript_157187/g.293256  ORF Transcript_157187/g.293256 Transcript_157187/m.293256 type:complete len:83 (+) Transcript_157187:2-250(+)
MIIGCTNRTDRSVTDLLRNPQLRDTEHEPPVSKLNLVGPQDSQQHVSQARKMHQEKQQQDKESPSQLNNQSAQGIVFKPISP